MPFGIENQKVNFGSTLVNPLNESQLFHFLSIWLV